MNKTLIWAIVTGVALVATMVIGVFFATSFMRSLLDIERVRLFSGTLVQIENGGSYQVFLEGYSSALHLQRIPHPFVFTNTATGEVVLSRNDFTSSYNIGDLHGLSVAQVYLAAGSWQVEFEPAHTSLHFVLMENIVGLAVGVLVFVAQIGVVAVVFSGLSALLVIQIVKIVKNRNKIQFNQF